MNFKGGMLLDESVNLGDISTSSFGTPLPAKGTPDLDDSPIPRPQFIAKDDENECRMEDGPASPLDDKAPAESTESDEDIAPERERTPPPKANPEPQTPSRRPKIQITMETEGIVVRVRFKNHDVVIHDGCQGKGLGYHRGSYTTWIPAPGRRQNITCERDIVCVSFTPPVR